MGLLDLGGIVSKFDPLGPSNWGTKFGETGEFLADPMDLFGVRAGRTQAEINRLLEQSASESISSQERIRSKIMERYEPFYQEAVSGALPEIQNLVFGGDVDYTPSKLYEYSLAKGTRNIKRTQAAKGLLDSSATEEKLMDLKMGLAQEDVDRLYKGQLSRLQLGSGAADAVSAASSSLSGNISSIYSNLASGLSASESAYGRARESAYQGLSSTLMGLASYMESN